MKCFLVFIYPGPLNIFLRFQSSSRSFFCKLCLERKLCELHRAVGVLEVAFFDDCSFGLQLFLLLWQVISDQWFLDASTTSHENWATFRIRRRSVFFRNFPPTRLPLVKISTLRTSSENRFHHIWKWRAPLPDTCLFCPCTAQALLGQASPVHHFFVPCFFHPCEARSCTNESGCCLSRQHYSHRSLIIFPYTLLPYRLFAMKSFRVC